MLCQIEPRFLCSFFLLVIFSKPGLLNWGRHPGSFVSNNIDGNSMGEAGCHFSSALCEKLLPAHQSTQFLYGPVAQEILYEFDLYSYLELSKNVKLSYVLIPFTL